MKPQKHARPFAPATLWLAAFLSLFIVNSMQASQKWVKQYQVPPATSSYTLNAKVIEAYDHGYITITRGSDPSSSARFLILSKFDVSGATVFEKKFNFLGRELLPAAVAENPSDHSLAIVGTVLYSSTNYQFLLKTDASGTLIWYQEWGTGEQATAVLFTHDPLHTNDIIVGGQMPGGTYAGIRLTEFDNSGTLVNDAMYNMGSGNTLLTADMVEITSTGQYVIAANFTTGSVTMPAWITINYSMASSTMDFYSYTSGLSGPALVSMIKYEGGSTPHIYMLGSTGYGSGVVPFIIDVDVVSHSMASEVYPIPTFSGTDMLLPTGITFMNTASHGLMISALRTNPASGVPQPAVFTTDLSLIPGSLHLHQTNPVLPGVYYRSITSTYNSDYYVTSGDVYSSSHIIIAHIYNDGSTECDATISMNYTAPSLFGNSGPNLIAAPFYGPNWVDPLESSIPTTESFICGCGGSPKVTYSRGIDGQFETNDFLRADYDNGNNDVYVPSTLTGGTYKEVSVNQVHNDGTLTNSYRYVLQSYDLEALAVSKSSGGDITAAGRATNVFTGDVSLFVMRTTASGTLLFQNIYTQSLIPLDGFIVITESVSGDIIVAASSASGPDHIVAARLQSTGSTYYYDDFQVTAAGNPTELYPYIKGIRGTMDNGYVLVGTTGHNLDFFGALVLKYDAGFTGGPVTSHTYNWNYIYRHPLASYNLTVPGQRSASYASDVVEEPSGNLSIVGYTSDNDQDGLNATYENGFVLQLLPTGAFKKIMLYKPQPGTSFLRFNGINIYGIDYMVTGQIFDGVNYQTAIAFIQSATLMPSWANSYDNIGTYDLGWSVFNGGGKFISVGVSNDNPLTTKTQPHLLSVNAALGEVGTCYSTLILDPVNEKKLIPPTYAENAPVHFAATLHTPVFTQECHDILDFCSSAMHPEVNKNFGIDENKAAKGENISVYPNPAFDHIVLDIKSVAASTGNVSVTDMQGREVYHTNLTLNKGLTHFEIDLSDVKPGMYFVKITDARNTVYPVNKVQKY